MWFNENITRGHSGQYHWNGMGHANGVQGAPVRWSNWRPWATSFQVFQEKKNKCSIQFYGFCLIVVHCLSLCFDARWNNKDVHVSVWDAWSKDTALAPLFLGSLDCLHWLDAIESIVLIVLDANVHWNIVLLLWLLLLLAVSIPNRIHIRSFRLNSLQILFFFQCFFLQLLDLGYG